MKLIQNKQQGFSFVEVLLVIVIIGVVAYVGVNVANRDDQVVEPTITPATQQDINNEEDLQQAEESLEDIDIEELDTTELDEAEADLL